MTPQEALKYHVTGAIERGEAVAIAAQEFCEYENDGQRITSPGKFEGEPIFAPYYWNIALEGFSDSDNGNVYTFKFKAGDADLAKWPYLKKWLGNRHTLRMSEDSQGFIHCF